MTVPLLLEHFDELITTPEDVEKLKRSILQLAMQGNLFEQNSNDEPAGELLKRIKAGNPKESNLALEITEDEQPFELPRGWKWVRLGELCRLENGDRSKANYPNKSILVKEGVPFVNAGHLVDGRIDRNTITFIPKERFDRLRSGKFTNGDILFCLRGSLGKSAIVEGFDAGAIASSLVILKIPPYLSNYYLLNYFDSPLASEMIKKYDNGTAQPNLSAASLAKFLIPLPPLAEQKRIVARVEELFAQTKLLAEQLGYSRTELYRLNESALARLLASETPEEFNERWAFIAEHFDLLTSAPEHIAPLRQSILELAVRGKLTRRKPGDEPAKELLKRISEQKQKPIHPIKDKDLQFELPDGWAWTSLNDISRLITDGTHVTPSYLYDGVPFLSVKDVSKGYLDFSNTRFISEEEHSKLSARCKPELGDVLLTKVGTTGIALVVDTDREFSIFVSIALLKIFQKEVSPNYLSLVINSPFVKRQSDKYTMGVGNKNLVLKYIKDFLIPLPPLAEQERIVKRVEQLLGWCDALEAQLQSAEEERGRLVESVLARVGG
jgi:type I restriction enzyme, S subunit